MHEVLKSLLAVCPIEIVDQKTGSGTPSGWSALSLLCNARDAANTRIGMVRMMLERRADTEASNPQGSTPLDSRLRERVLVSRALALGRQSRPQRGEKGRAERVGRDTEGPDAGSIGLHRVPCDDESCHLSSLTRNLGAQFCFRRCSSDAKSERCRHRDI